MGHTSTINFVSLLCRTKRALNHFSICSHFPAINEHHQRGQWSRYFYIFYRFSDDLKQSKKSVFLHTILTSGFSSKNTLCKEKIRDLGNLKLYSIDFTHCVFKIFTLFLKSAKIKIEVKFFWSNTNL